MGSSLKKSERIGRIIEAAAQLFARQGYHGTSTRGIARLADITETTLFRYFDTKEDIFWSTLRASLGRLPLRKDLLDGIARCEAPEVVLPQILSLLVDTVVFHPQLLCLLAVAFLEFRWKAESICREHLPPIFSTFNDYFAKNVENGRIRNLDPRLITSALAMTVMVHPDLSRIISGTPPPQSDNRDAIRAHTRFWLDLLTP
jgi:AcrR family transcriptional regulator